MRARKLFYKECHVAGRLYHDADEVWDQLKVGTILELVRDEDNRYDKNAVALVYNRVIKGDIDKFLIGYIPRDENDTIAALLEMGWNNIFECRISRIDESAQYEEQIHVTIRIKRHEE